MADKSNERIDLNEFQGSDSKPALRLEHLNGARHAILTIQEGRKVRVPDGNGGSRNAFVLEFQEFPDYAFWCNKQDLTALVERLGNDPSMWEGTAIPLTAVESTNPKTGVTSDQLHCVRPMDWEDALIAGGAMKPRKPAKKAAAKKAVAKRGAKK